MHIIELGAGHGKLAFLLVRELLSMREQWPVPAGPPPFRLVLTDFTEANLGFWAEHECLAPLIAAGVLDTAVFDAETHRELSLVHSGVTLRPGSLKAPVVAIANYVFDTLRQDAFRVVEGQLQEAMVSVYTTAAPGGSDDSGPADVIRRMRCVWDYRPCTPEIYKNPHLQVGASWGLLL